MQIRPGNPEDSANLSALAIQVWLQTYATAGISSKISRFVLSEFSVSNFEALLARASARVFLATVGENLVGYAVVFIGSQCPENERVRFELATLYVQEPFTRKAVGSRLLDQSESCARQEGSSLWLTVNSKNTRAIAFYAKHGYFKVGSTFFELKDEKHENLVLLRQDA